MEERTILKRLSHGSQRAIEAAVRRYSAYVVTVIHNKSQGSLRPEDEEEIAADVFFTLWDNAGSIEPGHLRPWLGQVSRNKTVDRLRQQKQTVPLEDNTLVIDDPQWQILCKKEKIEQQNAALRTLQPHDRDIFYRYYDLCQTASQIAADLRMQPSTVRTRLSRGRETLRKTLCQGGFSYE